MLQIFCVTKCYIKKLLKHMFYVKTMTSNEEHYCKTLSNKMESHQKDSAAVVDLQKS